MSRDRDDRGRYTETVTHDDVIDVFETVDGPVVTSGDVAEALDCSRETARRNLTEFEERGRIDSRKTAGRVVWWRVDDGSASEGEETVNPFGEEVPFLDGPTWASGERDTARNIDEVLYGNADE